MSEFQKAVTILNHLLKTKTEEYLLHGDIHHENILQNNKDSWLFIDPQPVIGEPLSTQKP